MKRPLLIALLLTALLTACGIAPRPVDTPTPQATLTISPTETSTPSPIPTSTPTETVTPTETPKPTRTSKPTKTRVPKDVVGCFAPSGTSGPTAPFKIENRTPSKVTVFINGVSRNGNYTIYCTEIVKQGVPDFLTLMWGKYQYMVQISGKTTMQGSFFINDTDKATMQIFKDKVRIGPFP